MVSYFAHASPPYNALWTIQQQHYGQTPGPSRGGDDKAGVGEVRDYRRGGGEAGGKGLPRKDILDKELEAVGVARHEKHVLSLLAL
ncbi:uncharacterized protein N7515_002193 [Penicillium bovifimosum]|uniref:Uncharacterized protein n=1 Tax=Penicillium bovifimosum TaxID=126998 RepID=A0A9W9HCZ9_9EURO|nr:uncharacterized protein N7515_002193 [Penicillium bovifimosum]KAJ5143406.1 hypothetical protein N7515_002193 [Penicillium bovifimosum]